MACQDKETNDQFFILYGSQTGQAEAISKEIHEAAVFKSYDVKIHCLKEENKVFSIKDVKCGVFVCSTTGDGELPENARKFVRSIGRKTLSDNHLEHLSYALLGLGDTNYSTFCGGPKRLEKALKARGASSFYPTAFADDGVGLEETVEPWIDGLFPALEAHFTALKIKSNSKETIVESVEEIKKEQVQFIVNNNVHQDTDDTITNVDSSTLLSYEVRNGVDDASESIKTFSKESAVHNLSVKDSENNVTVDGVIGSFEKTSIQEKSGYFHETFSYEKEYDLVGNNLQNVETAFIGINENAVKFSPLLQFSFLNDTKLTLPPLVSCYLELTFDTSYKLDTCGLPYQNGAVFPLSASNMIRCELTSICQLSSDDAVKKAIEVRLGVDKSVTFSPGDSFAICCTNNMKEVNWLIKRLGYNNISDDPARLSVRADTVKKNASVPPYIPQPFTIRYALSKCMEIRSVPKKPFLRALVACTSDIKEHRRLEELCSKQGASAYSELIRTPCVSLLDLLSIFPSCKPSFELLAQHLPRLQPRRYSIANSPLVDSNHLTCVFNVVRIEAEQGRTFSRNGVCTGYLEEILLCTNTRSETAHVNPKIDIFLTKSTGFCLPDDGSLPLVMIGPGTGVAPFVGFLEHRSALANQSGETWLFYGCRHKERDFLYEAKLRKLEKEQILTHLIVSFSRDVETLSSDKPRYVQDNLRVHKSAIVDLLLHKNAIFYVCGDARNMAKDVRECIIDLIAFETNCNLSDANDKFKQILLEKRYREDIWS